MTIYLDIVFFENVIMNFLIILATAIIARTKIKPHKMLLASSVGGMFSILTYIIKLNKFQNVILKIFISIIIVKISYNSQKIKYTIKNLILFYLVSLTFGGTAFMFLYFINPQNIISKDGILIGTYPLRSTLFGALFALILIILVAKIIRDRVSKKEMLCDLEIFYNGKLEKIKTLIDTGNLLQDPITNEDVIIVEKDSLKNLISEDFLNNIENIVSGKWLNSSGINNYKFKIIPFSSLGKENGILIGFKPDYIKVNTEFETVKSDVVIGIYNGKLSRNNLYNSLIGVNVLQEDKLFKK